jgi:hypothetical protein
VQVGSIVEYQYSLHFDPQITQLSMSINSFVPTFFVQRELFERKVSFVWRTSARRTALTSSLPGGASVIKIKESGFTRQYTADLDNVMPLPNEPYTRPTSSLGQRVVFYTGLSVTSKDHDVILFHTQPAP